jgi:hypothetical protein
LILQGKLEFLLIETLLLSLQGIAVYTFLGVWAMKDITSMKCTLGVVVAFWSFIAALVVAAFRLSGSQNFSFMGPSPVSHLNNSLFYVLN